MINKIKYYCQKVLPLVYDDSLSYYEVLGQLKNKINEIIESQNTLLNEWVEFKKKFNTNLLDTISKIMEEWRKNGYLDSLADSIVKKENGSNIALNRICNFTTYSYRYEGTRDENYAYMQGGCSDGNTFVIAYVSVVDGNNGRTKLVKFDRGFNILNSAFVSVNHCNDMTFCDGKIYATAYGQTGVTTLNKSIAIIDYQTLTLESVIQPTGITIPTASMIEYDHETECFYICYAGKSVNVFNKELNTLVDSYTLEAQNPANRPPSWQCMFIKGGYMYFVVFPNVIYKYDLNGKLIKVFNIGRMSGRFIIGEMENMFAINGKIVIGSCQFAGFSSPLTYSQFFNVDFDCGEYNNLPTQTANYGYSSLYADSNNTFDKSKNPDGSSNNPYPEAQICFLHARESWASKQIFINGEHTLCSLDGIHDVYVSTKSKCTIHGLRFSDSNNICFNGISFAHHPQYGKTSNGLCAGYDASNINFVSCVFTGDGVNDKQGVLIGRSSVNFENCSFSKFTEYCLYTTELVNMYIGNPKVDNTKLVYVGSHSNIICPNNLPTRNNSVTSTISPIRIFSGINYSGDFGVDDFYSNQLITPQRFDAITVITETNITATREAHIIPSYTAFSNISSIVKIANKLYLCTVRFCTGSDSDGKAYLDNNYVVDLSDMSVHKYSDGGDYPFLAVKEIRVSNNIIF